MSKPPSIGSISRNLALSMDPVERCHAFQHEIIADPAYAGFDLLPIKHCRLISASPQTQSTVWEVTITPALCNKTGNLHGGAAATLLDNLTSTALLIIARPGFLNAGHVSRTLTTTYLRPVPPGVYRVESEVVSTGKSMAHVRGAIKTLDGKVCVTCTHDKHVFQKESGAKL